jgi:hypothetical protein
MLSSTESGRKTRGSWCSIPTPAAIAARGDPSAIGRPSTRIVPASGVVKPDSTFMRVDFPAPFSPRSPWRLPLATDRSIPSFARTAP